MSNMMRRLDMDKIVELEDFIKLCDDSKDIDELIEKVKKLEDEDVKFSDNIKIP